MKEGSSTLPGNGLQTFTGGSREESDDGQGRSPTDFGTLRRLLANPSELKDEHRQRLRELTRRAARVRTSGGGRLRVDVSEYVLDALENGAVT